MDKQPNLNMVFVVSCYQNIVGVYAKQEDAAFAQLDLINKNRPADIVCRPIIYSFESKSY